MRDYFRRYLGARLLASYLTVILVGLLVLAVASQFALPASFNRHMLRMMAGAEPLPLGAGWRMMGRPIPAGDPARVQFFADYRAGFNDALMLAGAAAVVVAVALSLVLSRSITGPVRAISAAAQRIAAGHYRERVSVPGQDEISQLASRFNEMAAKLDDVESMRRRLIADVSHELRTPLTSIQGSMEGLIDGVLPASGETFEQIHSEAQRLNRLVDDLQELSRVEAHAFELQRQPVQIETVMRTVVKRLAGEASAHGVPLEIDPSEDLPAVSGDEDRLIQVLTNLAANALQYTPKGGRVTISARRVDGELRVSVRDTGIGIAAEHLPRIFDRFYRIDRSRSRQAGGGSGIGLTIARALVEAHGGRIWAESGGLGQGSIFTFALPLS